MIRATALLLGIGFILSFTGCADSANSCESIQEKIMELGLEIQQNPETALDEDRGRRLQELGDRLQTMDCQG